MTISNAQFGEPRRRPRRPLPPVLRARYTGRPIPCSNLRSVRSSPGPPADHGWCSRALPSWQSSGSRHCRVCRLTPMCSTCCPGTVRRHRPSSGTSGSSAASIAWYVDVRVSADERPIADFADAIRAYIERVRRLPEVRRVDAGLFGGGRDWSVTSPIASCSSSTSPRSASRSHGSGRTACARRSRRAARC